MPSESLDVHDFVVNKGHGVRGLSTMGLRKVPNQYVQPLEERLDAAKVITDESIPIIDVSNWDDVDDDHNVSDSICEAAKKYGFFQLVNHEIPIEVLEEVQAAAHRFFEQPTEEKVKYKRDPTACGTAKLGTSFSPNKEKVMEWKDYLSLQYFGRDGSSSDNNVADWPPICKTQAMDYLTRVQAIVRKICDALFQGLNVKGFDKNLLMSWIAVNFNYYPYCPNPELTVGVGRHSDGSALTVLLQDDVGGLFVRAPDGESWIHVPPTRGALVINIGDMLQILSNGIYKSIEHKVVANPRKNRVSIAIFVNPAAHQLVAPLPEVLETMGEKPLYREIVFLDYFRYFFSKGHDGKATIEWAKI